MEIRSTNLVISLTDDELLKAIQMYASSEVNIYEDKINKEVADKLNMNNYTVVEIFSDTERGIDFYLEEIE